MSCEFLHEDHCIAEAKTGFICPNRVTTESSVLWTCGASPDDLIEAPEECWGCKGDYKTDEEDECPIKTEFGCCLYEDMTQVETKKRTQLCVMVPFQFGI